jgi:hypothetical protein
MQLATYSEREKEQRKKEIKGKEGRKEERGKKEGRKDK